MTFNLTPLFCFTTALLYFFSQFTMCENNVKIRETVVPVWKENRFETNSSLFNKLNRIQAYLFRKKCYKEKGYNYKDLAGTF